MKISDKMFAVEQNDFSFISFVILFYFENINRLEFLLENFCM